jgi:hypothetical protein
MIVVSGVHFDTPLKTPSGLLDGRSFLPFEHVAYRGMRADYDFVARKGIPFSSHLPEDLVADSFFRLQ